MIKKFLSFTQLSMFLRCPRQYYYRYIEGLKIRPSGALYLGRVWHSVIESNYSQKVSSGTDLPEPDMKDMFATEYDNGLKNEDIDFEDKNPAVIKDTGILITSAHRKIIAPKVHPVFVEKEFRVDLGSGFPFDLFGFWDVIDDQGLIIDNKSFSKVPTQASIDSDLQLTAYSCAYRIQTKQLEKGLRIDSIIKNKNPRAIQVNTSRTNNDCEWFLRLVENVAKAIISENYYCNPCGWHCQQKFCGYWDRCKK